MERYGNIWNNRKNMQHTSSFESMTHDETVLQNLHKLWLLQVAKDLTRRCYLTTIM